jgi:aspartate/glutamate racemase
LEIKSLETNGSAIITLHTETAKKVGDKIKKMYQLVYFDEKNNVRKFGRIFGI